MPLHREHRHALQALDLHAERAASGGENLPVVGNERLRAGDVRARQVDDDLSGAAVDERHGAGVFGLFADGECARLAFNALQETYRETFLTHTM